MKKIMALLVLTAILLSTVIFGVTAEETTTQTTTQIAKFDIDSLGLENGGDIFEKADVKIDGGQKVYFKYNDSERFLYFYKGAGVSFNAYDEGNLNGQAAKISFTQTTADKSAQLKFLVYDMNANTNESSLIARTSNVAFSFDLKIPSGLSLTVRTSGLPSTSTAVSEGSVLTSSVFSVAATGTTLKTNNYTKDTISGSASASHDDTAFKRDEYVNFKIIYNYDNGTYDLYVNNKLVAAGKTLAGTKFLSDFYIQLSHKADTEAVDAFIDNLSYRVLSANDLKQVYVSNDIKNGTLTLNETFTEVGKPITFTATPDNGYKLSSITLDGKEIEGLSFTGKGGTYTIESLPYGGELKAVFEEKRTTTEIAKFDVDSLGLETGTAIANKTAYKYNGSSYFAYATTTGNGKLTVDGTDNQVLKVSGESGAYSAGTVTILRNDLNANRTDAQKEIRTNDVAISFNVKLCVGTVLEVSAMGLPSTATISKDSAKGWMPDAVDGVTPSYLESTILSCGRSGTGGNTYSYTKDSVSEPKKNYVDKIVTRDEYVNYKIFFDYDEGTYDVYKNDELIAENNGLAGTQFLSDFKISLHHQSGYANEHNVEAYLDDICFYSMAEEDTNIQTSVVKSGNGTVTADKFLIAEGDTVNYTITPAEGSYVRNVTFNGEASPAFSASGTSWKIENVTSANTLKVEFGSYEEGLPAVMISPLAAREDNTTYLFCKLLLNGAEVESYGILFSRTTEIPEMGDEATIKLPFFGEEDENGGTKDAKGYFGFALTDSSEGENPDFYARPYAVVNGEYVYGPVRFIEPVSLTVIE